MDSGAAIDPVYGRAQFREQIEAAKDLMSSCDEFTIGLNGDEKDAEFAGQLLPRKSRLILHGPKSESLLPTMRLLQDELTSHKDWAIGFGHTKGITRPNDLLAKAWRDCMMSNVVIHWRRCVSRLEIGFDAAGCHWLRNSPSDPNADRWGGNSFFAGVFWWGAEKYLSTLPKLPEKIIDRHTWFQGGELWLGCGQPNIFDFHPAFPTVSGCEARAR